MPELPEVETLRRQLAPRIEGSRIIEADAFDSAKFTPAKEIIGAVFESPRRRGKYLIIGTDDDRELIIHLGMTGQLGFQSTATAPGSDPYRRAWWLLEGAAGTELLEFRDVRRFGRIRVVPRGDYSSIPTLHAAGPEPWDPDLTPKRFRELLSSSRRPIKTQLLSQRPIAGVGNIYADEALWEAGIHPRSTRLGLERASRLLRALQDALAQGVERGGTTLRDYRQLDGGQGTNQHHLHAYGRAGLPCERCNEAMRSSVIDARTTTFCPRCQRV